MAFDGKGNSVDDCGYPKNLTEVCSKLTGGEFAANNDAVCFAKGAYKFQKLKQDPIIFPCLVITLGTGVGATVIKDKSTYVAIELTDTNWAFSGLEDTRIEQEKALQKEQVVEQGVDCLLGKHFFEWIPTDDNQKIAANYQARVHALCKDVFALLQEKESIHVASIVIGGGNSRFLQTNEGYPCKAVILSPSKLASDNVSQDIIQLLGCQRNLIKNCTQFLCPQPTFTAIFP